MRKIIALMFILLFCGCAKKPVSGEWLHSRLSSEEPFLIPEKQTIDVYAEWNMLRLVCSSLRMIGNIDKEALVYSFGQASRNKDGLYNPSFCLQRSVLLGEKLFDSNQNHEGLDAECVYEMTPLTLGNVMSAVFGRNIVLDTTDENVRVFYAGDSLLIEHGQVRNHKRIKQNYLAVKDEQGRIRETLQGRIYEFDIPLNEPVFSLTVRTDSKDFKGYKPLKLDSSILPLESPGYKKLREQEKSFGRGE
jgi:hypothetical protein